MTVKLLGFRLGYSSHRLEQSTSPALRGFRLAYRSLNLERASSVKVRGFRLAYQSVRSVDSLMPLFRGFKLALKKSRDDTSNIPNLRGFRLAVIEPGPRTESIGFTQTDVPDVDVPFVGSKDTRIRTRFFGIYRAPPSGAQRMRHGKYHFKGLLRFTKRDHI